MIHSRDVKFNELVCGVEKESSANTPAEKPQMVIESRSSIDDSSNEEVKEQRVNSEESDTEPEERTESTVRRSQRETKKPDYYGIWINNASDVSEPNTVEEALRCSQKENWK